MDKYKFEDMSSGNEISSFSDYPMQTTSFTTEENNRANNKVNLNSE
jgi:hypothetical protein